MQDDKATAWLTLADADAIEQKVLDVMGRAFAANVDALALKLAGSFHLQNSVAGYVLPQVRSLIAGEMRNNFKVEHYYEQWNRTAGYRIRYGDTIIQTEQIKLGF
jgi:hypothetical protein